MNIDRATTTEGGGMGHGQFVVRCLTAIALAILAALFLIVALTAPMIAAATPTLFTLATGAGAYFMWPKARPKGATA